MSRELELNEVPKFHLPRIPRWLGFSVSLIMIGAVSAVSIISLNTKPEDVSAGSRTNANQFDFSVERIYHFNDTSWTADPSTNFGKSYNELKWSPFDADYGAGYIDIGNGLVTRTCSADVPGETSTTHRTGSNCYFPSGRNSKDEHNYFDVQNGGHNAGNLYDVRMYVWSVNGNNARPYVRGAGGADSDGADFPTSGQFRYPGSFGRGGADGNGITGVEFHFYKRGTLYDLDGNHKSAGELTAAYLAENEVEFKGVLRVDDIDPGYEGYTPTRGVEQVWITRNTYLRMRDYSNTYLGLLPANCTGSTAAICKHWMGTVDNNQNNSWSEDRAALWMEFDGKPNDPFTIVYTTSGHASSVTSKLTVVNYVLMVEPEDGFYPSLDPIFEQADAENKITRYDLAPYNIPRIYDDTRRTIRRFGVTTYSWFDPTYNPDLPAGCTVDGWYDNQSLLGERVQDSSSLVTLGDKKLMILQNSSSDLGWDSENNAYYFYGVATCDPIHEVDNSTGCESGN